ncbi:hypothetical protein evm_011943 [Chilo suppressalis]|nr:hypothetical protein evm_011943 [Chilo suppressalis]
MKEFEYDFEKAFRITTKALHLNRAHPFIERNLFWCFQFLLILTLSVMTFVFTFNSLLFYDIPAGEIAEASKNGTMAIVSLTITFKYTFLLYNQNYIKRYIAIINKDYELSKGFVAEERAIVIDYSRKGAKVSLYWLVATTATSILFPVKALVQMVYYHWEDEFRFVPMFDMRYPTTIEIMKNVPAMFCLLFLLCLMFDVYATTMYVGFDPLVPIFLTHICGQLDILSQRIMDIFSDESNLNSQEVNYKLKCINVTLQDQYNMTKEIKSKFTFLYEFTMKTTTILLPLSMFQIVEDLQRRKLNLEFISFFFATILHFYMPCYYSDMLMDRILVARTSPYLSFSMGEHDGHGRRQSGARGCTCTLLKINYIELY